MDAMHLKPFFTYFGGKHRSIARYPEPKHGIVIEPFAGSAGYACRYPDRHVLLVDMFPAVIETWRYLIRTPAAEILALPDIPEGGTVTDLQVPPEARYLIGWWLNKGSAAPCKTPSAWMRAGTHGASFWGPEIRQRIAAQVDQIRHWRAEQGSYVDLGNTEATWFIDPPYQVAGKDYKHGAAGIDFAHLGGWCRERRGQVLVCENEGATWLPFEPFALLKGGAGKGRSGISHEVLWSR